MRVPLLLVVPSAAMAVVGFALFGPGAVRPFNGAQIWGGPTEGASRLSWRILVLERLRGIDSTRNLGAIMVRVAVGEGSPVSVPCQTRPDGTCEIQVALAELLHGSVRATVEAADGSPLASGEFARDARGWGSEGHPTRITGHASGELHLEAFAARGVFAAPFSDALDVYVYRGDEHVAGASVTLRADEADIAGARNGVATTTRSLRTAASFVLAPRTHVVDATASASFAGLEGSWNGILPVVPGAIWLDPELVSQHRIRVVAPVPREVAYATIATRTARLWGGAIALAKDERGFAAGEISWPDLDAPAEEPKWLTLASDPRATGAGTVGWPLHPDAGERAFRDWLLLDGMPRAEERDNARRHRARTLSAASLFAAAVLEGVLLAHGTYGRGMRSWAWLAVAIATVVFAFAALGVVAMWRTIG